MGDFEELMGYVEAHTEELAWLGCQSLSECLATGKKTKHREGDAERLKYYRAYRRMYAALSVEQEERWKSAELRICSSEDMTTFEDEVGRVCAFFGDKRDTLIALQKDKLMAIANSGQANKDKEQKFFQNFMKRVVLPGKLPKNLRNEFFAWEDILCVPEGMFVPTALEAAVTKFIDLVEEKQGMLSGLKATTAKELFSVHAMKEDAGLRFGCGFVTRQYEKLDATQQEKVDAALCAVLWSKEQVSVKSGFEAKLACAGSAVCEPLQKWRRAR